LKLTRSIVDRPRKNRLSGNAATLHSKGEKPTNERRNGQQLILGHLLDFSGKCWGHSANNSFQLLRLLHGRILSRVWPTKNPPNGRALG
jgi:hypothetical protein